MTAYRDMWPEELPIVIALWSSSYKGSHFAGIISSEDWATVMHAQIAKLIARPTVRTVVATSRDTLYGFICGDLSGPLPVVHYVYVKAPYRAQCVEPSARYEGPRHGSRLFAALGVDPLRPFLFSCRTALVARLADKIPRGKFAPAAARYSNYQETR